MGKKDKKKGKGAEKAQNKALKEHYINKLIFKFINNRPNLTQKLIALAQT